MDNNTILVNDDREDEKIFFESSKHRYEAEKLLSTIDTCKFYLVKDEENNSYILRLYTTVKNEKREELLKLFEEVDNDINIQKIIDNGVYLNQDFDILPNYQGKSLVNVKLSINDINLFLPGLIQSINFLHENNIIHNNITLENVFYDNSQNKLILGDFITSNHSNGSPYTKRLGYTPFEELSNPTKETDLFSLGITLASLYRGSYIFSGMNKELIESSLNDKTHCSFIEDKEFKNLILGLTNLNLNDRFTINDLNSYISNGYAKRFDTKYIPTINELSKGIKYLGKEFTSNNDLYLYIVQNWEESIETLKSGKISSLLNSIDISFKNYYQDLIKSNSNYDALLSKILISFNSKYLLSYKGKNYLSFEQISLEMLESLPTINEEYLSIIKENVLIYAMKYRYQEDNDDYYSIIDALETFKGYPKTLYYYICYLYANELSITIESNTISNFEDLINLINKSTKPMIAYRNIMAFDQVKGFLLSKLNYFDVKDVILDLNYDLSKSFHAFINCLKRNDVDISKVSNSDFSEWLLNNYKKYTYKGDKAGKLKNKFKKLSKERKKIDLLTYSEKRNELKNEFIELFQNQIYFKYHDGGIRTNKFIYYPYVRFNDEIVTIAYLQEKGINTEYFINKFFSETKDETLEVLKNSKDEIDKSYNLHSGQLSLRMESTEYIKSRKTKKVYIISLIISLLFEGIYQALRYIPFTYKFINDKYPHVFLDDKYTDNYYFITLILALVPIMFFIILIPLNKKIRRVKKYRKAVNMLTVNRKYIDDNEGLVKTINFDKEEYFKQNKKPNFSIDYARITASYDEEISECNRLIEKKLPKKIIVKFCQRVFTLIHTYVITAFLSVILVPILLDLLKETRNIKQLEYYLVPLVTSAVSLILSFVRFKKANIGRIVYYLSVLISIALTGCYFWFFVK